MSPKRGSSGAWGTASGGKLVTDTGDICFAMLWSREREEDDVEALDAVV